MATTAALEKVVREVLDDEMRETKEATLQAIQRVSRLLTEQVIPHLPDDADQPETAPEEEMPVAENGESCALRGRTGNPGSDPADHPEMPEADEDEPPPQDVPAAVTEAFEALYSSLSAEQAKALAAMFTAISREPSSEET